MGIHGLLKFTKNASRESHLQELSGTVVAVDAYCWLHKGCYSCAEKLVKGEKTNGYVNYCMKLVNLLVEHNIKPILVFDGMNLPSKTETELKRRENRQKYKKLAKQHLREGNLKAARDCFNRCVNVTSMMALQVIQACRNLGVDCIVAPYEADAQLAYLNKQGFAQTVITEDSDLILFGCERIFYKMDLTGRGILIEKKNLHQCSNIKPSKYCFEKFRRMCIISGCDYLPSLPGIGLVKACKFFMLTSITDIETMLRKLPSILKMPNLIVDAAYIDGFIRAENTFKYQLAFCPNKRKLVPNEVYPDGVSRDMLDYAGPYIKDSDAFQVALGNIDVNTMKRIDNFNPDLTKNNAKSARTWNCSTKACSIWHKDYLASNVKSFHNDADILLPSTKNKVVMLSFGICKKVPGSSPKKYRKSPRKCKSGDGTKITNHTTDEDELTSLYNPETKQSKKQQYGAVSDIEISKSPPIKRLNPFRIGKKSPQKKVISRFFCNSGTAKTDIDHQGKEEISDRLDFSTASGNSKAEDNLDKQLECDSFPPADDELKCRLSKFSWKSDISENLFEKNSIILTNSPSSQCAFKPLEVSTPNSLDSADRNEDLYEPILEMSANSVDDSYSICQNPFQTSNTENREPSMSSLHSFRSDSSKLFLSKFKKSSNAKNLKKCGIKKPSSRKIGLLKPTAKSALKSSSEIQLSLKQSLEGYRYKRK